MPGPIKARLKALAVLQQRSMIEVLADALHLFERRVRERAARRDKN